MVDLTIKPSRSSPDLNGLKGRYGNGREITLQLVEMRFYVLSQWSCVRLTRCVDCSRGGASFSSQFSTRVSVFRWFSYRLENSTTWTVSATSLGLWSRVKPFSQLRPQVVQVKPAKDQVEWLEPRPFKSAVVSVFSSWTKVGLSALTYRAEQRVCMIWIAFPLLQILHRCWWKGSYVGMVGEAQCRDEYSTGLGTSTAALNRCLKKKSYLSILFVGRVDLFGVCGPSTTKETCCLISYGSQDVMLEFYLP